MAFAVKYRLQFYDENGKLPGNTSYTPDFWKVEILEDGFAGSVTDLEGFGREPVKITWERIDIYGKYIMPSSATIDLKSDSTLEFSDIVLSNEFTYRVDIYRNSNIFWKGFIDPADYTEKYSETDAFKITLYASDGLQNLDGFLFDSGTNITKTIISVIADCLNDLNLSLDIYEDCSIYDVNMSDDTTASNSSFEQLDISRHGLSERGDGEQYFSKGDILKNILEYYGCTIRQANGAWYINQISNQNGRARNLRKFNSSGVYQSVESAGSQTITASPDADPINDDITITGHPYTTGDKVIVTDNIPAGVLDGVESRKTYYVGVLDANTIALYTSLADAQGDTDRVDITAVDTVDVTFHDASSLFAFDGDRNLSIQTNLKLQRPVSLIDISYGENISDNLAHDGMFKNSAWDGNTLQHWTNNTSVTYTKVSTTVDNLVRITSTHINPTTGDYLESRKQFIEEGTTMRLWMVYRFLFSAGSGVLVPQSSYQIVLTQRERGVKYYWDGNNWQTTVQSVTISTEEIDLGNFTVEDEIISAAPVDGDIQIRIYEPDPNSYTLTSFDVSEVLLYPDEDYTPEEKYKLRYEVSSTYSRKIEKDITYADIRGYINDRRTVDDVWATVVQVEFGLVAENESFSIDFNGTTQTFTYKASPTTGNEFNSGTGLRDSIENFLDDLYAMEVIDGGSVFTYTIYALYSSNEVGTSMDFNGTGDTNITVADQSGPVGTAKPDQIRLLFVTDEPVGYWTDTGGYADGDMYDVQAYNMLANFGANGGHISQRHIGRIIDHSKSMDSLTVFLDNRYNDKRYFFFTGGSINLRTQTWDGEWQEVYNVNGITVTETYIQD